MTGNKIKIIKQWKLKYMKTKNLRQYENENYMRFQYKYILKKT